VEPARDELLDDGGRLRAPWRRMLGSLLGMGTATLAERRAELDRAFAAEGAVSVLARPGSGQWHCDPIPYLFTESEFDEVAAGLAQRARVLEAVLQDLYGARTLLADGVLPPALVYGSPAYLRPCRAPPLAPGRSHLQLYAADLVRGPDGQWRVLTDRVAEPSGLAHVLENRRMMARVLPELFRSVEVSPVRPFFDLWADALQRLAPPGAGNPGLALLTPGHADPRWFEHVVVARELGCTLVEDGDLTVRDGALWLKTLRGLQPVHVLLRRTLGRDIDPLELYGDADAGVPGLLSAVRNGAVQVVNSPGAGLAEAPGITAWLPEFSRRLFGEELQLASVRTQWLGNPDACSEVLGSLAGWLIRDALDPSVPGEHVKPGDGPAAAALAERIAARPWAFVATAPPTPSYAPCVGGGDTLEPRPLLLRLFMVFDGARWRPLPGGMARIVKETDILDGTLPARAISKDVWVLVEDGNDIVGPANLAMPALPIRRMAGDLPSRVADNFYWLGRYMERLDAASRLSRAIITRLARAPLLPRDLPEVRTLAACLVDAGVISDEFAGSSSETIIAEALLRSMTGVDGIFARVTGQLGTLVDTLRDRLSGEMHAAAVEGLATLAAARQGLRGVRAAASISSTGEFARQALQFGALISGYAAENMVRGGGRLFLDLGRRIERAQAISRQLAHAFDQPAGHLATGLLLALELCDSTLTYRARYLTVLQVAPVLDLVVADDGNPRGLGYQLVAARRVLGVLGGNEAADLAAAIDPMVAETRLIVSDLVADGGETATDGLPRRLRALEQQLASLSDAVARQYFALLPVRWTDTPA
jgi:uncharacterized circularly permuted ATP-grasp superfamily protein/uncharacterized alpha-E superfamily protein